MLLSFWREVVYENNFCVISFLLYNGFAQEIMPAIYEIFESKG